MFFSCKVKILEQHKTKHPFLWQLKEDPKFAPPEAPPTSIIMPRKTEFSFPIPHLKDKSLSIPILYYLFVCPPP